MADKKMKPAVLFVCLGNTCRSVIAETLARRELGDLVNVASAGLYPQPASDAAPAIGMLKAEYGLDASHHVPRDIREVSIEAFDYVVAMHKSVASKLTHIPREKLITWRVDDPWGKPHEYRVCAKQVLKEMALLKTLIMERVGR